MHGNGRGDGSDSHICAKGSLAQGFMNKVSV